MKTLTEQTVELGTIELSVDDMKQAINEFLSKSGYRTIDIPLEHNLRVEVLKTIARPEKNDKAPKFKRQNIGVYRAIREFLNSERRKGIKSIKFEDLYNLVKVEYPLITEDKLNVYLYDKDQFKGIRYSKNIIYL